LAQTFRPGVPIEVLQGSFREETTPFMDVLGGSDFVLRNGSQAQMKHGLLMRAKDEVSRALSVCVPSTDSQSASVTAACTLHRIERIQHIRSIGFARPRGRCRFAVQGALHRMGARG